MLPLKKKNIVIWCLRNQSGSSSWLKTTQSIIDEISIQHNLIEVIDYSIQNPFLKKIHKFYSLISFGHTTHRDPFDSFFSERKFKRLAKKQKAQIDIYLHISNICIPEILTNNSKHIAYVDASIFGSIKIKGSKLSSKFLKKHIEKTNKIPNT